MDLDATAAVPAAFPPVPLPVFASGVALRARQTAWLLGAGASADAGVPTAGQLIDDMLDLARVEGGRLIEGDDEGLVVRRRNAERVEHGVDVGIRRRLDVNTQQLGAALDGLEDVGVARGIAGIDELLPRIDEVASGDRIAVGVLDVVTQVEGDRLPVRADVPARRQPGNDVELLVVEDEGRRGLAQDSDGRAVGRLGRILGGRCGARVSPTRPESPSRAQLRRR